MFNLLIKGAEDRYVFTNALLIKAITNIEIRLIINIIIIELIEVSLI